MVRALVVSDTHLGPPDRLPAEVWDLADAADVVTQPLLDALAARAPLHAVCGNNDHALVGSLPEELEVTLDGVVVAMVHDSGPTRGRHGRMARRFPRADVVVFGHSHQPLVEREGDGPLLVNPGSPTQRRRQPVHTVAWLELADGGVRTAEIREVGPLAQTGRG